MNETENWINSIVRKVAELPDRDSPKDHPEMMTVTDSELRLILEEACIEINLVIE